MLDYGEFVPEALLESGDSNLRALGNKMDLFSMFDANGKMEGDLYRTLVDAMMDGTHAITETTSYLKSDM